ncbi:MAG: hypothetical protein CMD96_06725 [Gammaproteobacteria bacterium]|jgi:kynurenine formamidase|nr:hypothetical protein [Gammaproteobacteria bacterium]HJP19819.1 cyclase family protein [Nitrospinota bacterium]|tara:strand:- start:25359 stop:26027 length:669 start_codon:yes stop_codon:yes gene_type:complete
MILLSYPIKEQIPTYRNGDKPLIQHEKQIKAGDKCNTVKLSLPNHVGTHVECPAHFSAGGRTLTDYPPDFWFCRHVQLFQCNLNDNELCNAHHLQTAYEKSVLKVPEAEAVILMTGWYRKRNAVCYWQSSPGFLPNTFHWLRETFPKLRFFGFDVISLSSYSNREIGRDVHKAFLCNSSPILIIEDMDFSMLNADQGLKNLLISPLFVSGIDGSPCSLWGNL